MKLPKYKIKVCSKHCKMHSHVILDKKQLTYYEEMLTPTEIQKFYPAVIKGVDENYANGGRQSKTPQMGSGD